MLISRRVRPSVSPHKMSCCPNRNGRETRRPRGGQIVSCYGVAANPKTYQPSGERAVRHIEGPGRSDMTPEPQPRYYMHGQQRLALPPQRTHSSGWEEERQFPRPRNPSPDRHNERLLADSETLPARWGNEVQPTKKEMRDIKQPTSKGARVHFQRPVECRPRTPEDDDDEEGVSGSSTDDSLEGSLTIVEKDESRLGDRKFALSHSFDVVEDEGAGIGDEDGYVYVPRRLPLCRST